MQIFSKQTAKPGSMQELIPIAMPIFFSQAIDVAMMFCDRYFLARLGKEELAATLSGGILCYVITALLYGTLGQVIALVGQYQGAGETSNSIKTVHQAFFLTLVFSPIFFALAYLFSPYLFELFGHEKMLYENELKYFRILALIVITTPLRLVFANFFIGIGKTSVVTLASFVGVTINIPLSYILIFGGFGIPSLGIEGAAIGTILASLIPIVILAVTFYSPQYREEYNTAITPRFNWQIFRKLLRYGLPAGVDMFVNVSAFLFFTMVMYSYSSDVAAATTIVLNWDMVSFLPLMGISQAVSGQIGKYLGEKKKDIALSCSWSAIKLAWCYALLVTIIYLSFTDFLVDLFITKEETNSLQQVFYYGRIMLQISCFYLVFDATYNVLGGILKGSGDTVWTMIVTNTCMWTCALVTYFLKNHFAISPIYSWIMLTIMVFCLGTTFLIRFLQKKWLNRMMIE
ncbi:MAG: MATE family efflux transporter [Spirochaetota bacterium]